MTEPSCDSLLSDPTLAEVRAWLERDEGVERAIGDLERADSDALVDRLYAAGATTVLVSRVEACTVTEDGEVFSFETAHALVARLPAEPEARRRVFERHAENAQDYGLLPAMDLGQSHLSFTVE